MSTPSTETPAVEAKVVTPSSGFWAILGGVAILPILFFIFFHSGAAYLSYQKYGSFLWAALDFFFAYFYYPYYAFFLSKDVQPPQSIIGGRRLKRRA
jgi:hypothetical protein